MDQPTAIGSFAVDFDPKQRLNQQVKITGSVTGLLSSPQFALIISENRDQIVAKFIDRVLNEVAGAEGESRVYLKDHLPVVLDDIAAFLDSEGGRGELLENTAMARKHGRQRADHHTYTADDLRIEYGILSEVILSFLPPDCGLSAKTSAFYGKVFASSLSFATETFVRNSAKELLQHKAQQIEAGENVRVAQNMQRLAEGAHRWFEQALDKVPKPLFLLDLETKSVTFSNQAAQHMLGFVYAGAERLKVYGPVLHATDAEGHYLTVDRIPTSRILAGEQLSGEEIVLTSPKGVFHLKCYSEKLPESDGRHRSALLLLQDITSFKEIEGQLRKTQQTLNQAIQISNIGFWHLDVMSLSLSLSNVLLRQFGLDPATFNGTLGEPISRLHHEDRARIVAALDASIYRKAPYQVEHRVVHPNGDVRWLAARGETTYNSDGNPVGFSGTCLDITDEKQHKLEIEEARQIAEKASTAKSQFLANMSHEIRTPLGAIMGFASLMKDETLSRKEQAGFVAVIERNSTQLLRIIDDILDLSKVEAGMMLIENIEFSLPELLADFTSLMAFKAREKGISFSSRAVSEVPKFLRSDPTRLRQILVNVAGNAIKFTDKGGVEMRIRYADGFLIFEVEDTGRGISPEQVSKLFQPFAQADSSTTRKYGGTGLGLVLTRSLAQALGGTFDLKESFFGKGSIFEIKIAAAAASDTEMMSGSAFESSPVRTAPESGRLAGVKVLLVEDSPDNQALISIFLDRAGARTEIASDGHEGFGKASKGQYDIVLMDVQMPVMDGVTAVKKLRATGYARPVLALTAHAMKEERVRCLEAGFTDFLSKPVNREELTEMIARYTVAQK